MIDNPTPLSLYVRVMDPAPNIGLELEFEAAAGITVIFGPSGAGKTTLLDCIAGLRSPRAGWIRIGEEMMFDSVTGLNIAPQRRNFGYVFQSPSLFPHLSVEENVRFGIHSLPTQQQIERARQILEHFGAAALAKRSPRQLSGGEQQRVAIARALARDPKLLLLDEPLTGLDSAAKDELVHRLQQWVRERKMPAVYVTHAIDEVFSIADQVLMIDRGKIVLQGSAREVLANESARLLHLLQS
jgi:molybdate transport system ATP-binding protein